SDIIMKGLREKGRIDEEVYNMVTSQLRNYFRPEFLNRIDEIVLFKPLERKEIKAIVDIMLKDLYRRLDEQNIKIEVTDSAKDLIVEGGFDPVYGARPIRRFIEKNVETDIGHLIIKGELYEGCLV